MAARAGTPPFGSLTSSAHPRRPSPDRARPSPGDARPGCWRWRPADPGLRPVLVAALAEDPGARQPPLPLAGSHGVEEVPPLAVARRLGVGLSGAVVFCGSLTSLMQNAAVWQWAGRDEGSGSAESRQGTVAETWSPSRAVVEPRRQRRAGAAARAAATAARAPRWEHS